MQRYRFHADALGECDCDMLADDKGDYYAVAECDAAIKAAQKLNVLTIRDKEAAEQRGAERERAAIIAWCEKHRVVWKRTGWQGDPDNHYAADAIRRGDHHAHGREAQP